MQVLKASIEHILLIDDDNDDCDVFGDALKAISQSIILNCKNQCEEIIPALESFKPDLIFLDINIPRITGLECLKEIQHNAQYRNIPIIMYSSSDNVKEISTAYGLGASLFFKKPTNFTELVQALTNILAMAWDTPHAVKANYFRNGQYHPFENSI